MWLIMLDTRSRGEEGRPDIVSEKGWLIVAYVHARVTAGSGADETPSAGLYGTTERTSTGRSDDRPRSNRRAKNQRLFVNFQA